MQPILKITSNVKVFAKYFQMVISTHILQDQTAVNIYHVTMKYVHL